MKKTQNNEGLEQTEKSVQNLCDQPPARRPYVVDPATGCVCFCKGNSVAEIGETIRELREYGR